MENKKSDTRRTPGLETTQSIIHKAVAGMGKYKMQKFLAHQVFWHWSDIVGDYIAKKCQPQGLRKQVLYLYCPDSALRTQLMFMQLQIIGQINEFVGCADDEGDAKANEDDEQEVLVKELCFTRRWEHPESEGVDELRFELKKTPPDIGAERQQMPLSTADMQAVEELGAEAQDEEIGEAVQNIYRKHLQMQKLREKHGWHPCAVCGRLTEPDAQLCMSCELKRRERINKGIRRVLSDIPWARCAEVREYVPECTPALLNYQRAFMVQRLASEVELTDINTIKAKNLVMLYRCLPPEQLNEDVIRRALYDLRNNLHKPKDYVAPKRYDYLQLGKRHKEAKS